MSGKKTASAAHAAVRVNVQGDINQHAESFACPHSSCGTYALHHWGAVRNLSTLTGQRNVGNEVITAAKCSACGHETIWVGQEMVWPVQVSAPAPAADMPSEVIDDFEEARRIHSSSPRGAAALLRLVVQKICPILGSSKSDINGAIGDLVSQQKISPALQQALDSVRVIGNEAVHPGELDIKDDRDTVESLFKLINFIVYEAITRPKEIAAIYNSLPANKLAGIVARDKPKAP